MPNNRPAAEFDITPELVRDLIAQQTPQYAGLPCEPFSSGWDNKMFRLGDDLAVRLPRRQLGADLIINEQKWLPSLSARLTLPVPSPLFVGQPELGYPWNWSIVPFFAGQPLAIAPFVDREDLANRLAEFLMSLHVEAPADAPQNPTRGVALKERDDRTRSHLGSVTNVDKDAVLKVWKSACEIPLLSKPSVWLHGDLHPLNLIVDEAKLISVIDFGDLTSGDPATDLAIAWMAFDGPLRETFRNSFGGDYIIDEATWERARGAALAFAIAVLANSADDPVLERIGRTTLNEVLND